MSKEKHTDSRVLKTRNAIRNAFLLLLSQKAPSEITVTDIALKADVDRKTVYNYYEGTDAILNELENELVSIVAGSITESDCIRCAQDPLTFLRSVTDAFEEYPELSVPLLRQNGQSLVLWKLTDSLSSRMACVFSQHADLRVRQYAGICAQFLANGIISVYREWIRTGMRQPLDEIAGQISLLLRQGIVPLIFSADDNTEGKQMTKTIMTSGLYASMIACGAAKLNLHRTAVNELNVFPVPDGDTGDNMYMTIDSGRISAAEAADESLGSVSLRIAKGMLLGARGNSGVILSRIFSGIAKSLSGCEDAGLEAFAKAMENGISESYRAVPVPVEGTMLTVYSDAVRYANARIGERSDFESYFSDLLAELRSSLDRTPQLLDILRESGVVDSGGAGLVFIAEGMLDALRGIEFSEETVQTSSSSVLHFDAFSEDTALQYGYCTEFLLRLQTVKVGNVADFDEKPLITWLTENGESVVAFREGSILKVHIHTMAPEEILAHCHGYGEFLTLKIENMMLQHHESDIPSVTLRKTTPKKKIGIVAVASGDGIRETFLSIGADAVVDGGQSMNPPAESFLKAFAEVGAETILVYPNNSNVLLTAKQAGALYPDADVRVLPSKTIGECYGALSLLDTSSDDADTVEKNSIEVMKSVRTGTVSKANRTTVRDGVSIREGDYIGFSDETIYCDSPAVSDTVMQLADHLEADSFGILLLVRGIGTDAVESESIRTALEQKHPMTEVILLDGGQPIYDYIMILE